MRHLITALAPYAGAKLRKEPRLVAVHIIDRCANRIDADIRSVSEAGIEVFFLNRCDLIAWADVCEIALAGRTADGDYTGREVVLFPAEQREAA